jgi:hypothetical protein
MYNLIFTFTVSGPVTTEAPSFYLGKDQLEKDHQTIAINFPCNPCSEIIDVGKGDMVTLTMTNKKDCHTIIQDGKIVDSVLLNVARVTLANVDVTNKWIQCCTYTHNNNGATDFVTEPFYGALGYNGVVSMTFDHDPIDWLVNLC